MLVVEMAKLQARIEGATEDYVVTREFREISTMEQRLALLRCCFAVEAADGTITRRGGVGRERDRPGARHRADRPERASATSSTSSSRRSRRCARSAAGPDGDGRGAQLRLSSTIPSPSRRRTSASSSAS